jgi:hypothetical protein
VRVTHPLLADRDCLRVRTAEGARIPNSATRNDARARTFLELLLLPPRRTVVRCASGGRALMGDPPGKATSFCAVVWCTPFGVPRLFTRSRVSRPRLLFRARPALAMSRTPAFAGAPHTSTESTTSSPRAARFRVFRRIDERPAMTSRQTTWAEACELKDPATPTPSGVVRGGRPSSRKPRAPLMSPPRARVWLESPARLGKDYPERPRSPFASPPAKEETRAKDQGAWNRP